MWLLDGFDDGEFGLIQPHKHVGENMTDFLDTGDFVKRVAKVGVVGING